MSRPPASALSGDRTIRANGLSKRYGQTLAVDDLSFEVEPGRVTGFIGPNGAGKTTTMRLLLGLDAPTGGTATIGGLRYRDLPAPMREVGALIDANAIHPSRTAYHHPLEPGPEQRDSCSSGGRGARHRGAGVGCAPASGKLSLGMKQRLGIAAALLGDPPVLMFDEPVNGLDPEGIVWIRQLMRALAAEGRTVFVSSHLMSEMAVTADHVIVVGHGHLLRDEAVSDFIEGDAHHHVLVRCLQLDDLTVALTRAGAVVTPGIENSIDVTGMDSSGIGELAASHGFILHELATQQASLEDAFMDLTHDSVEFRTTPAESAA
ncbi:MAG: ATP-binding cassette domain-containing protein [Actinomycetota bacterium]|nr:ATP-binding cassette domain-containing protein [Actinomycetota bacterium]